MFRELDAESWNTKGFTGSLLEKVRKELGERGAEKPKAVLLPVVKQDRAGGTEGTARPPRIGTLPSRPPGPVMLPLATETERERGGVFGGSRAGGAPQQEKKPIMLPLAGRADAEGETFGTSYDVQAKLDKLRTSAAAFRTAQSDFLTIGGDPGTDAQLERTEREIAALTPIYEQKKKQEAERSDAEKWVRWNALASRNRPLTEGEKAEAKDAMREMGYVLSRIPSSQEEREKRSSYEQLYGVLHNETSLGASIAAGFITAVPFAKTALKKSDEWLAEYATESEEKYPELSIKDPTLKKTMAAKGSIAASFQDAKDTSPIGYAGGQVASNVMQMYGLGKLFGAAVKGAPLLSKLPTAIQGALATGGVTGTMGALHEAEEGGSAGDVAKSFGVNALAGGAGSLASAGVGALGTKALFGLGVQNPVPAVILRDGLAGAAFSAGSMGTRYALDGNYRPTSAAAAKDVAVGFFFGAVTSLLKSANMTREAKARMSETVEQMKRDYGTILADSGGSVTFDALEDLAAKSAEVRNTLRTTQFVGQQDTVNGVMAFLDTLDDAVARARAGMGTGITGWNGNMQGMPPSGAGGLFGLPGATLAPGGRMGGMPMLPAPVAVKDAEDQAIEEGWADEKQPDAKSEEDIDSSWEDAIIASIAKPISPSGASNSTAVPGGRPTVIRPKDDAATVRSITRENEAAQAIARSGYIIEQQPKVEGRKKPDYRIEEEIFDCYAPMEGTRARNIRSNINRKVVEDQTKRIVLNLDDWTGTEAEVLKALQAEPVSGLEQVLVVKGGKVYSIFP